MSSPASLITSIDSAMKHISVMPPIFRSVKKKCKLKIGLRTLKLLLLLCLRKVDDDDAHLMKSTSSHASLFVRIEDVIARILLLEVIYSEIIEEVHSLGIELDDELPKNLSPSPLTVLWTVDFILGNADDLLARNPLNYFEVIHALEVHTSFLTNFLPFVEQTGVELEPLLFHIQPVLLNAACVFIAYDNVTEWCDVIGSECSIVDGMATDPHLCQLYTQSLTTSHLFFSRSQEAPLDDCVIKNFLSSLISVLWDVLRHSDLESGSNQQFKELYERLRLSRAILKNSKGEKIMGEIGALICDAGLLISSPHHVDTEKFSDLLQRFGVFQAHVQLETSPSKAHKELVFGDFAQMKISDDGSVKQLENCTSILSHRPSLHGTPQVPGFQHDEINSVLNRLTRGSKQLHIVPIAGMAGLGKTTFALELYNHSTVMHHFQTRAWCPVSQVLDRKKVLLELLNKIQSGCYLELTEDDLAEKLRRSLKRKRYLILLDDVWNPQVWEDLRASFPDDSNHSRIIITSRHLDIAPQPHKLRLRSDDECLKILRMKLFHTEGWNPELGMEIAKVCKGVPLTTVIVAGILATTEQERWLGILDGVSLSSVSGVERALELSYEHLPDHLHQCYLYLGAFLEDQAISVKLLIRLWMAEGFVQKEELKRTEDVAREYVDELVERSLVMVSGTRSRGGVSYFRMHDLLRDFCQVKSKQENLFHLLEEGRDELSDFNEPSNLERLVLHSDSTHFKESRLFCPQAQSILLFCPWIPSSRMFDMSFMIHIFQLLKVLEMPHIYTNGIPSEIQLLTRLRFLSMRTRSTVIPSSLGMLYNLETFILHLRKCASRSFPHTLGNLRNLRHLCITHCGQCGFTLPAEDGESFSSLMDLKGIVFCSDDGNMEKQLRKFPNICNLKCSIVKGSIKEYHEIVVPEFLSQLESLSIWGKGKLKCEFGSTDYLRKLKLSYFELSREQIAVVGKLPNLEVLKLDSICFPGKALEMEEEEFPKLRILELRDHYNALERWTASDYQLPCLQKLKFLFCKDLEEIPSFLETSSTLVEIEVRYSSSTLESVVRDIQEVQKDYGNTVEVHIVSKEFWL